jgi:hypothetical protein
MELPRHLKTGETDVNAIELLKISVLEVLAKGNGGLLISNSPSPISPNSFRIA